MAAIAYAREHGLGMATGPVAVATPSGKMLVGGAVPRDTWPGTVRRHRGAWRLQTGATKMSHMFLVAAPARSSDKSFGG